MSELLTVQEVAKILRVEETSVRRWVAEGILEATRLPSASGHRRGYRIKRETLNKILNTPVVPTLARR